MSEESVSERALVIAVEARTLAQTAHDRQDAMDRHITDIREVLSRLREDVTKLNTKVAIAATFGSMAGGVVLTIAVKVFG